jgi:putative chitinase
MTDLNWPHIQTCIGVAPDGIPGPRTYSALFGKVAGRDLAERGRDLGVGASQYLARYRIVTPLRLAHFLGQTAHESGRYKYLREIWGPTPQQARYEGRIDLGNVQAGDGKRFMGRGILQITGYGNYHRASGRIGVDIESTPELAERPDIAVLTACDFWAAHNLNELADADDLRALTRAINGGTNGIADRIELTNLAKDLLA